MQRFLLLLIIVFITSCSGENIYNEYKKFDNVSWNRFDIVEFEFPVNKNEPYNLNLALRHHTYFPFSFIDVNITIFTPDGEIRSRNYHYNLKTSDLEWKGKGMGEIWDIELPIRKQMIFNENGNCKILIENKMSKVETPGIMELGLIVDKSLDR